nr:anaerobic ribonucleoside-triphosphate reductase activating protein [candidate division Zixibacteria bacterium]
MIIGGLQRLSLIDYPGKICAVVFTRGCNFRCRYCHNPELVVPEKFSPAIPLRDVYDFLHRRSGLLQAVCISGGEPAVHPDLLSMLSRIKEMGYLVKLDSNGSQPGILKEAIGRKLLDYVAIDIKAPWRDYGKIVGVRFPAERLTKSIALVMSSEVDYEFRTTVVRCFISPDDIHKIARSIRGARRYILQNFGSTKLLDETLHHEPSYSDEELAEIAGELKQYVEYCGVRKTADQFYP